MHLPLHQVLGLLSPIQSIIGMILPDFLKQNLDDPKVRELIITAAAEALVTQYPWAKLVPEKTRRSLIEQTLGTILGHTKLPS